MKTIGLLNDTSNTYHWGCYGTSMALKEKMEGEGYKVLSASILLTAKMNANLSHINQFSDPRVLQIIANHNPALFKVISESDIIVINGEGTLHRLSRNVLNLLYVAYVSKVLLKKKVMLINHSAYPNLEPQSELSIPLYSHVYKVLDYVAIREHISLKAMQGLGVKASLSFDCLPLAIEKLNVEKHIKTDKIVLSDSVIIREDQLDKIYTLISDLMKQGKSVTILHGAQANPARETLAFIDKVTNKFKDQIRVEEATSFENWVKEISEAELLISGRFHYTIAAAFLDTPFIMLDSNTPKNVAIQETFKSPEILNVQDENLNDKIIQQMALVMDKTPLNDEVKKELLARASRNFDFL